MAKGINIFGVKFAYPKGLRKSPGTNAYASCVGGKLDGQHGGRAAFRAAAHACKGTRN